MEGLGEEVSQKIRSAIKAKLMELGVYVDEELPDYVMVMVANKRTKEELDDELQLFLGNHTTLFTTWLHQVLQKLQEVTVANIGIKRKASEITKKKKKSKSDTERKVAKKKIKEEPEEDKNKIVSKKIDTILDPNNDTDQSIELNSTSSSKREETVIEQSEKSDSKILEEKTKERRNSTKNNKTGDNSPKDSKPDKSIEEYTSNKSQVSSLEQENDMDDDCINIRADGELLDAAEDVTFDELPKESTNKNSTLTSKSNKSPSDNLSPLKSSESTKDALKPEENKEIKKKRDNKRRHSSSSPGRQSDSAGKLVDARELLNRRKAARKTADTDGVTRSRSSERSSMPDSKRRHVESSDSRGHREDNDRSKRSDKDRARDSTSFRDTKQHRRDDRNRDLYQPRRQVDRSRRTESDWDERDNTSTKRSGRSDRDDGWISPRPAKIGRLAESRKGDTQVDSLENTKDIEEPRKRGVALLSRVVPKDPEPEDVVDNPVPSVVKITPRPRRPPSQQASSTLIMKAISDANKSLASALPRPDSTQQTGRNTIFKRTMQQLARKSAPTVKANTIQKGSALTSEQNTDDLLIEDTELLSEEGNESPEKSKCFSSDKSEEDWEMNNEEGRKSQKDSTEQKPETGVNEEVIEDVFDPQFVVTLNGYDPDGLYSQSEIDAGDDAEREEWIKSSDDPLFTPTREEWIKSSDDPLFTSTPDEPVSPQPKQSPTNKLAVNHSNLIEVELVKAKSNERCKFWPACRLAEKCTFYHPTKPCKTFPACKFGDTCLYIHPQCKFNAMCTRKDCVFAHSAAHAPQLPIVVPKPHFAASSALLTCKFYPNCMNASCPFRHAGKPCRYGIYCSKKESCPFDHMNIAPVEKLKWTRCPAT